MISFLNTKQYKSIVNRLYFYIQNNTIVNYTPWKEVFTRIHGNLDTQRKVDDESLNRLFDVNITGNKEYLFRLIFCLESFYSIILRMLAYCHINDRKIYSNEIFDDKYYQNNGLLNYSCEIYYNWFLSIPNIDEELQHLYDDVAQFHYSTKDEDIVSRLFELIFPKQIRHSLGEFYTPYWLAQKVICTVTEMDVKCDEKTYVDPSCGSGTFLMALINSFKQTNKNIYKNICGIDINPLTVLAAKTNYIMSYSQDCGINSKSNIVIPIYCADTIAAFDSEISLFPVNEGLYESIPNCKFDYVVGNPPWVNWEYLPVLYRKTHADLWQHYGLFNQKGMDASFIKEDISVLMTYVAMDKLLKDGGRLAFVLKETLFKSVKQGEGFRKFKIIPTNTDISVYRVDDLTSFKPFREAVTRTAILYVKKGEKTCYPIDYYVWKVKIPNVSSVNISDFVLNDVFEENRLKAHPSVIGQANSGWITESVDDQITSSRILGKNLYKARTGVFTGGANGIFWLNIEESSNIIKVSNITDKAKIKVKKVSTEIEKDYVFPLLTGKEIGFWEYSYSRYILCPHSPETKMYPIEQKILSQLPLTNAYFEAFKEELENRKGFTSIDKNIHERYYYTLQRIGEYTFAKYKVCWRYISKKFTPVVVEYVDDKYLGRKNIIGNEKVISIGLDNREEAYYLCGLISSTPYRKTIENYMIGTQITPSILSRLNIPQYDSGNDVHRKIAEFCRCGHFDGNKEYYLKQIDDLVIGYYL